MAKFTKSFENGIIKNELVFQGESYDFSMNNNSCVMKSNKKCFSFQMKEYEELFEENDIDIDMIDCGDEDDVLEILEKLEEFEGGL